MYVVMDSTAHMPSRCWGTYRRVAVVQVDQYYTARDLRPKMISTHARGIVRIVRTWEKQSVGTTDRCGFSRAVAAAEVLAYQLNNVRDVASAEQIIGAGGSA